MTSAFSVPQRPAVGSPATYTIGSDSYAGEVVKVVPSGKTITIQTAIGEKVFTYRAGGYYKLRGANCGILTLGKAVDHRSREF